MKVLLISTDRKILEENSLVRARILEYGSLFEELHVVVFSTRIMNYESRIKLSDNVFVSPTNSTNKLMYLVDAFRIVKKLIENSKLKIENYVLSTQDPFETGLTGLLIKLRYKLPLQVQIHTDFANKYFITHSILNFIRFPLGLLVLSFADSVRVVSGRIAKSIYSLSHSITVLPISTPPLAPRSPLLAKEREERKEINFLTVCRLEKEKNLETLLKAFKKVIDGGIEARLVIVGDGSQKENLKLKAKSLKLEDKIQFAGWQNDLSKYYEQADIYVSTSLYEGYGVSMVEAAEHGLAVIASNAGVAEELTPYIFEPRDIRALTQYMQNRNLEKAKTPALISKEEYLLKYKKSLEQALICHKKGEGLFKRNILARYLVSGFSAAGTNIFLLYIFTHFFHIWYLYSSVLSFVISIAVSFSLQKLWTFQDKKTERVHHQFARYMLLALFGIILNTLLMFLFVDILNIWYILGQIMTGGLIAIFNFVMYKFFVFNKN